jgi:outer membrane protein
MNMRAHSITITILFFGLSSVAQDKWDLKKCVEYAWAHNVTVKQADIQAQVDALTLKQNRLSQYPTANFNTSTGLRYGRSIDPTTNQFATTGFLSQQYSFQTNVTIFNWNSIRNSILASHYAADASRMDVETAKNDVGLSVANGFLQALLAKEQVNVAVAQVQQTLSQLNDTRRRVLAGTIPELNAVQLESQLALDSSALITAKSNADLSILQLKALMYVDAAAPFDIVAPPVDLIPVDPISELQPDHVFELAMKNQPAQKSNELRFKSQQAFTSATKAQMYPTISAFGQLNSNFASSTKQITGASFNGYEVVSPSAPPRESALIGGVYYPVVSPQYSFTQGNKTFGQLWSGWGTQLNNNFGQGLGVSINVPIFNGGQARTNYEKAKLQLKNISVQKEQVDQTLKQNIYQAYTSSVAALQKYNASVSAVNAAEKSASFARKRYDVGLLSTLELITAQTNLTRARLDLLTANYDYVFKMKVLEFYKGQGLRL